MKKTLTDTVCHSHDLKEVDPGLLMGKTIKKIESASNVINIQCTDGSIFCIEAYSNCQIVCQKIGS